MNLSNVFLGILTLNNYPTKINPKSGQHRIGAHTDVDVFTIIAQTAEPGGLQVQVILFRNTSWINARINPQNFSVISM